ncbi:MAG: sugar ABC transporter permease [Ardenticatenaceae bacterium]|nr:sugar ABC transporter permease [Ardenticatenaceae bacterium]
MARFSTSQTAAAVPLNGRIKKRRTKSIPLIQQVAGADRFWVMLFLLPFIILYTSFTLWPLLATIIYSFFDWDGNGPLELFIRLENYITIARDPLFWLSFRNTLVFALINTAIKLPLSLMAAILLTRKWLWGQRLFRTVYFAPLVIPVAMAGLIFQLLLHPANGAINDLLTSTGLVQRPIDFLGNERLALLSLVIVSVWQIFGQYMIYWMAALQNVPEALYEAAELDGAGEWKKLVHITLPIIRPVAIIILFLAFVNALKVFGLVVTMTGGGPGFQTYVVPYFIYTQALVDFPFRYGYASAAAVLFGVTILLAVTVQGYFVRRAEADRKDYGV